MNRGIIGRSAAKSADDFDRSAKSTERILPDDFGVLQIEQAVIRILVQQGGDHLSGKVAILREVVPFLHLLSALLPRQWLLLKGDVANEVEGIEGRANFLIQGGEDNALPLKFLNDGPLFL